MAIAPKRCVKSAIARRSTRFISGLVGDSIHTAAAPRASFALRFGQVAKVHVNRLDALVCGIPSRTDGRSRVQIRCER